MAQILQIEVWDKTKSRIGVKIMTVDSAVGDGLGGVHVKIGAYSADWGLGREQNLA